MSEHQTYTLSFLFVLVTASAVGLAMIGCLVPALVGKEIDGNELLATSILGGVSGIAIGLILGCCHINRWFGLLICGLLGAAIGAPTACLFFVDTSSFPRLLISQIVGAAWVLFLAAVLRFGIRKEID